MSCSLDLRKSYRGHLQMTVTDFCTVDLVISPSVINSGERSSELI